MIISQSRSDEKNQGKLETASITEDVIVLRNVSPKTGDFGYAACEQRKEQELNGFRYVKECLISVLALILVIAVTAHWCRRQKRSLDCLADEMSHQFVFQLLLVSLFLFGHYCSSADDCDWSTWTDLDSDNMQHRVKDFGNGSIQIISRHCKHRFYDIPNVTEHERQNKLPIVIYRCPKTAATPGLYHSYEPKIDLASDVPIETRETPEIPTVISNREISTWDKNPKLNQTKLIEMLKNIIIGALSLALIGVSTMLCIQCKKRTSVIKRDSCALSEMEFRSRQRSERTRSTTSSGYAIPKIRSIISSGDSTYNRLNECNYMNTSFMTESQSPSFIDDEQLDENSAVMQSAKMQVIFEKMANGHQENTGSMDSTSTSHSYINVVEGGGRSLLSDSLTSSGYTKPNQDIRKQLNDVLKKIPKSRGKVSR
ncbi:uncharacterized protein [Magallana gigas]|uniref:uncharacterized protein isoform X1 n=1 Tax=Magallana gigas TaxID=29159 RepID=UPI003342692E